jgi:hypothetical protein
VASTLANVLPAVAANGDALTAGGTFSEATPLRISNTSVDANAGGIIGQTAGRGAGVLGISETGTGVLGWVGPEAAGTAGPIAGWFQVNLDVEAIGVQTGVARGKGVWAHAAGVGGVAVYGQTSGSQGSVGVAGVVDDSLPASVIDVGVYGQGPATPRDGIGVFGQVQGSSGTGVVGIGEWGVYGFGPVGVVGDSFPGATGLYGHVGSTAPASPPPSVAVYASAPSTAHTALQVNGKAVFSRSGKITIGRGRSSVAKALAGVTASSLVIATLQTYRAGVYIAAATPALGSFRIRLNKAAAGPTVVVWMILN